jgi:hypothetical protein
MKKIIIIALIFTSLLQSACVTTLQPLVTYDTIITDDRITGKWKNDEQEITVLPFPKSDFYNDHKKELEKGKERTTKEIRDSILFSKAYLIEYTKDGFKYELLGGVIKINGQLFMNFTPVSSVSVTNPSEEINIDPVSSLSGNTIAKVEMKSSTTIKLNFLDGGFIYDQVKAGHLKIKNERDDLYDTFLITASTVELQKFLEKYGKENRFYNKENSVTLNRKN